MILENRELVFSPVALRQAFEWYATVPNQSDLPLGVITSVTPREGGSTLVQLQQSGASRIREAMFTPSKTLAVLLYFCRKQRIPIPRDAEKDILSDGETIILTIHNKVRTSSPTG